MFVCCVLLPNGDACEPKAVVVDEPKADDPNPLLLFVQLKLATNNVPIPSIGLIITRAKNAS